MKLFSTIKLHGDPNANGSLASDKRLMKDIKDGKHVLLGWKTELIFLMKELYFDTDRCDYSLGKYILLCPSKPLVLNDH